MKMIVVLAMHGIPPKGFPKEEMMELFSLHHRIHSAGEQEKISLRKRHEQLDEEMRRWPRTEENDPFYTASQKIAHELSNVLNTQVLVGFNEFCSPTIEEAVSQAAAESPDRIIVATPMMTGGGEHSEVDIPSAIVRARVNHPDIEIVYAWPYQISDVAVFLAEQIKRFL